MKLYSWYNNQSQYFKDTETLKYDTTQHQTNNIPNKIANKVANKTKEKTELKNNNLESSSNYPLFQ